MKVGLIGGGPRALWAAEELVSLFRRHALPLTIICWDPEEPGGGRVYRAEQPFCWRLNVRSDIVRTHIGAFPEWLESNLSLDSEGREVYRGKVFEREDRIFAPRAVVGDFLRESWRKLVEDTETEGSQISIVHVPARVVEVRTESAHCDGKHLAAGRFMGNGCCIVAEDGSEEIVDEVLVVTGHAAEWDGQLNDAMAAHDHRSVESIPAGANVVIRGLALTFIDACLALTEGRGGKFVPAETGQTADSAHPDPAQPGGPAHAPLRYIPSGREPARIFPYSRSGELMHVKPDPSSPWIDIEIPGQKEYEKRIRNCADVSELRVILNEVTDEVMNVACHRAQQDSATHMRQLPAQEWARGEVWRRVYPAIVERASYLSEGDLDGFFELERELEPIAFGPPPVTAKRIDALVEAEIVVLPQGGGEPQEVPSDVIHVDAVVSPPGLQPNTVLAGLVDHGEITMLPQGGPNVGRDGKVPNKRIAVIGRDVEPRVIGHDTLNRTMHKEIPNWANGVFDRAFRRMHATEPLTGRLEPWMHQLLRNPQQCTDLIETYDSPVNVLAPHVLSRNAEDLVRAGQANGVDVRVFYARKANKGLSFVDAALAAGHGVDVASERELQQVLSRGAQPDQVILSAAVKPDRLLQLAVNAGVYISVDSVAELHRIEAIVGDTSGSARVVPRIAPNPNLLPPTRFGELVETWEREVQRDFTPGVEVHGVHLHLHGYSEADRRIALADAIAIVDAATLAGHPVSFIDLGGGVPMSYLDAKPEWDNFQEQLKAARAGERAPFTWKGDPLNNTYPFWQEPTREEWLKQLLAGQLGGDLENAQPSTGTGVPVAEALRSRNLRLHMEPGRSLLDGGGVILARVAFVKKRSDGVGLVGLEMNRTQCRTTSDDILVDPILVPAADGSQTTQPAKDSEKKNTATHARENAGLNAFLVGAYCIEDEVIIRREMHFPEGVESGDIIAIPNTAGYFMHILESASHQIPLARNVFVAAPSEAQDEAPSNAHAEAVADSSGDDETVNSANTSPLTIRPDDIDLVNASRTNSDSARAE
ncbi:FAD/NAD(P)-binding protein [Corynebacterium resistens]|uniref:FAD/NAD(P)-binding protein n=1 Tax=Corynebacterium resistens TaxID=258224 RepID=UPI0001E291B5|nr:FAD/NAD(P)-binding protein [Corynebacterium resistens]